MRKIIEPHFLLTKSFLRLQKKNTSYSMRALARDLNLSPSYVSRILKGNKPLPLEQVPLFASVLRMDQAAVTNLKKALLKNFIQDLPLTNAEPSPSAQFEETVDKDFPLLENWYNITLLDLATCESLPNDPNYIAARLGISSGEARHAIIKLLELGYLQEQNGFLIKTQLLLRFPTTKSHSAVRNYHRVMLSKAASAMLATDQASFDQRSISSISVAANPANIAKARARLTEALYEVCEILREGTATEVIQVAGQIFPISKSKK